MSVTILKKAVLQQRILTHEMHPCNLVQTSMSCPGVEERSQERERLLDLEERCAMGS